MSYRGRRVAPLLLGALGGLKLHLLHLPLQPGELLVLGGQCLCVHVEQIVRRRRGCAYCRHEWDQGRGSTIARLLRT